MKEVMKKMATVRRSAYSNAVVFTSSQGKEEKIRTNNCETTRTVSLDSSGQISYKIIERPREVSIVGGFIVDGLTKIGSFALSAIAAVNLKNRIYVLYWMNTVDSSLGEKEIMRMEKEQFADMPLAPLFWTALRGSAAVGLYQVGAQFKESSNQEIAITAILKPHTQ